MHGLWGQIKGKLAGCRVKPRIFLLSLSDRENVNDKIHVVETANDLGFPLPQWHRVIEASAYQKAVEALRKAILWAECISARMETRDQINWTYLNEARATLKQLGEDGE